MEQTYYLLSCAGVDVIIIPELDCRINIIDPVLGELDPEKGKQIVFGTILDQELAFQAVGEHCPEVDDMAAAIRWYSHQKTFPKRVA